MTVQLPEMGTWEAIERPPGQVPIGQRDIIETGNAQRPLEVGTCGMPGLTGERTWVQLARGLRTQVPSVSGQEAVKERGDHEPRSVLVGGPFLAGATVPVAIRKGSAVWIRRGFDWRDAEELFRTYVLDVESFWDDRMRRQADKLQRQVASIERQYGWKPTHVVDQVLALARSRRPTPPPAVYVTGLGSSGSHWLAGMLAELDGFVDVGEVYFSAALREALDGLSTSEERLMVADAIQLLHGLPTRLDLGDATTVNSAAGAYELDLYRAWDPRAVVVYLYRDPRDQVLSAAFRKEEYRQYQAPEADDMEYLLGMCRRNRSDHERYLKISGTADHEVAYEQLRADAARPLRAIAASAGRPADDQQVENAVRRHDADAIRAGNVEVEGNLDLGGRSRGWRQDTDRGLRAMMHAELAETIVSLGYPLVECLPEGDELGEPVRFDAHDGAAPVICAAGSTAVTDGVVAEILAYAPVVLDLARTGVTDDAIADLVRCNSLRVVCLHGTSVGEEARRALREARPELTIRGEEAPSLRPWTR